MNLSLLVLSAGAFSVGCLEWFLAIKRTVAILNHRPFTVALTVFLESYIAFIITLLSIKEFSTVEALLVYGIYCIGGACGSLIPLRKSGKV